MENSEEIQIIETSTDVIYQQDKAMIDIQVATANAYPRNLQRVIENALAIVQIDQETAKTCNYSVPRGGKSITGPTIHLAKILLQEMGNMRAEVKVISIEPKTVVSQAICWDLQKNTAIKVEVRKSIMTKTGRMNDDMITVTGNACNSIALRNAIFVVVPKQITDKVYNVAKQMITGDVSDENKLIKKRKEVFKEMMETYDVTESQVLYIVGKEATKYITPDDLMVLIGVIQAIKDGDTTVNDVFKSKSKDTVDKIKEKMRAKNAPKEKKKTDLKDTDKAYIQAKERMSKGENVMDKMNELFNLTDSQKKELITLLPEVKTDSAPTLL